jgi:hypothetical protein
VLGARTATKLDDFNNKVELTDTILVTQQSKTYEFPDDGFNGN